MNILPINLGRVGIFLGWMGLILVQGCTTPESHEPRLAAEGKLWRATPEAAPSFYSYSPELAANLAAIDIKYAIERASNQAHYDAQGIAIRAQYSQAAHFDRSCASR